MLTAASVDSMLPASPFKTSKQVLRVSYSTPTSYFDGEIVSHHAVSGRQVSVHELLGVEVGHPVCYLSRHLDHLLQGGWGTPRIVLQGTQKIWIWVLKFITQQLKSEIIVCFFSPPFDPSYRGQRPGVSLLTLLSAIDILLRGYATSASGRRERR